VSPLIRVSLEKLLRARRTWLTIAFWVVIAVGPALQERLHAVGHGADHALLGLYASIALPFLAYSVLSAVLGREGLSRSGLALVNFGAPAGRVALSTVTVAVVASAVLGGVLGAVVDGVGHGTLDPPLAQDALRAFAAGALGGSAYAALFAMGASFGARGFGRSILLLLDWVLGDGVDASALLTPRAHVRSLLGGAAPLDVSGRVSYAALALMVIVFTALACERASRAKWNPARGGGTLSGSSTRT
jgi:hypothetical protein